jgi:integrase
MGVVIFPTNFGGNMATRKKNNRAPNSGSISINPSGSVRAQILLPGGKRLTKSFPTKREADAWLREMRNQVDAGLTTANHNVLLADFAKDWLNRKRSQIRPKTFADYTYYCNEIITPHLGELNLRAIKLQRVNDFYSTLAEEGRPVYVIRYSHRVLHAMLEDAVKLGYIPQNPSHYADLPVPEEFDDSMSIFSAAEYQRFIEACSSALHGNLYKLAIKTGMRQGELLGLTWENVDLERGEICIIQQISRYKDDNGRRTFRFAPLKPRYSRRTIKVGVDLVDQLKAHQQAQKAHKQIMGIRWQEHDLVFPSSVGTPLDHRNLIRDFDEMLRIAGLPKIRFHDLRHNAASMMLAGKTSIVGVSRYLGHSSPQVTLGIYAHLVPGGFDEIVNAMSALPLVSDADAIASE